VIPQSHPADIPEIDAVVTAVHKVTARTLTAL
jgi:hypothetical protein